MLQQHQYRNTQSSSGSSTLYAYKTDFSIAQTIIIVQHVHTGKKIHGANKEKVKMTPKKTPSEIQTTDAEVAGTSTDLLPHFSSVVHTLRMVCPSTYQETLGNFDQKKKKNPSPRTRPRPPPAESGETSKVRHVEQTPHRMVDFISI